MYTRSDAAHSHCDDGENQKDRSVFWISGGESVERRNEENIIADRTGDAADDHCRQIADEGIDQDRRYEDQSSVAGRHGNTEQQCAEPRHHHHKHG
jgi:hypothetical protein